MKELEEKFAQHSREHWLGLECLQAEVVPTATRVVCHVRAICARYMTCEKERMSGTASQREVHELKQSFQKAGQGFRVSGHCSGFRNLLPSASTCMASRISTRRRARFRVIRCYQMRLATKSRRSPTWSPAFERSSGTRLRRSSDPAEAL